jgi:hypothetical protein
VDDERGFVDRVEKCCGSVAGDCDSPAFALRSSDWHVRRRRASQIGSTPSTRRIVARRQRRLRGHVTTDRIPFRPRAEDVAHPEAYALDRPRLGVAGGVW